MILQVPTKIKIDGIVLELENVSRELGNTFDDYGMMRADYVATSSSGMKSEFNIEFMDSDQFGKLIKQAKGEIVYE